MAHMYSKELQIQICCDSRGQDLNLSSFCCIQPSQDLGALTLGICSSPTSRVGEPIIYLLVTFLNRKDVTADLKCFITHQGGQRYPRCPPAIGTLVDSKVSVLPKVKDVFRMCYF